MYILVAFLFRIICLDYFYGCPGNASQCIVLIVELTGCELITAIAFVPVRLVYMKQ